DHTLVRTDFDKLILRDVDEYSTPLIGSHKAMESISQQFRLIYLTARPRFLLEKTRFWLDGMDYPSGPVIASPGIREALHRTEFKVDVLTGLRKEWPNMLIGVGNSESDGIAYRKCGLLTLLITDKKSKESESDVIRLANWKALGEFFEKNRALLADSARLSAALRDGNIKQMLIAPGTGP